MEINNKKIHKFYDGPLKEHMQKYFGIFSERLLVSEHKYVRSPNYPNWEERYANYESRPTDVWVVTYPKAGTTWTQEIVWCILNSIDSEAGNKILMKRFPFFEWDSLLPEDTSMMPPLEDDDPCKPGMTWKILHELEDPRTIKSHLHLDLLPRGIWKHNAKVVYVARDPRDVCVSYYYHSVKLLGFDGQFTDYLEIFLNDLSFCSPYWKHVLDFWNRRDDENILFMRYEELQEDLSGTIRKIARFLGRDVTDSYIQRLKEHVLFSNMKNNPAVNNESICGFENERSKSIKFMRSGKVGDWRLHFTEEHLKRFRKWTEDNLKNSNFPFYRDYS